MTSPSRRTFTASEVCEIAQVQPSTLRAWRLRDLVVIEAPAKRNGWNRYTANDVGRIVKFVTLVRSGIRARNASEQIYGVQR